MDFYKLLGLSKDATQEEIKKAYRNLAKKYHPDINKEHEAYFKLITQAYNTLIDPEKREKYDKHLEENKSLKAYIEKTLEAFLIKDKYKKKGKNIHTTLKLSLHEAYNGTVKEISYKREENCNNCKGTGIVENSKLKECSVCFSSGYIKQFGLKIPCIRCKSKGFIVENPCPVCEGKGRIKKKITKTINVPAGIQENEILFLEYAGDEGYKGGKNGDLYIKIRLKKDKEFIKKGLDLYKVLTLKREEIFSGKNFLIKDLNGDILSVKIPQDIFTDSILRIKGKGFRDRNGNFGDLLIKIKIL